MTRLDALRLLYEAVKAGTAKDFRAVLRGNEEPGDRAKICGWAAAAAKGRVDPALAFIAATLPGWAWDVSCNGEATLWPPNGYALAEDDPLLDGLTDTAAHPAPALLLAGLAAHIAEEAARIAAQVDALQQDET